MSKRTSAFTVQSESSIACESVGLHFGTLAAQLAVFAHWKDAPGTVDCDVFTEPAARLEQCAKSGDF